MKQVEDAQQVTPCAAVSASSSMRATATASAGMARDATVDVRRLVLLPVRRPLEQHRH